MKHLFILAAALSSSVSQGAEFGAWSAGIDNNGAPYMVTINDSGNALGKWCDQKERMCWWMLATPTKCDDGGEADGLISTSLGVTANSTVCVGAREIAGKTFYRFALSKPASIDEMVLKSKTFSFVMALESDNFKVMRFSMKGAPEALEHWQYLVAAWLRRLPPSTKDSVL